ncbi:MAG TPA: Asp-tRNA(Asn)/Glu-tRNA(Gln) amidotransferase subunit GatC [Gemmatimonadales bacterium]|nr:Asp-tRNA(Asn)/Glu-tRNA(Gln) amidotransferase subunit GatC [Gemmatimonadales bacterium]
MSIGRDDVLHVARLAELAVRDEDLDRLVEQLNRIVDYVAQLERVRADGAPDPLLPGPEQVELREDAPGSVPLARPPAEWAPEFAEGFFLVPRHGAMEDL